VLPAAQFGMEGGDEAPRVWHRVVVASAAVPYSFLREELRRVWCDLRGGELSALRVAGSVAVGAFIGCLPLFGLHLPLVLFASLRFRLDGALGYLAANISNPFVAPLLITAELQLGAYLLDGELLGSPSSEELRALVSASPAYLAVGAPIVGLVVAVGLGLVAFIVTVSKRRLLGTGHRPVYRLPESAPAWVCAVERVARRYAPDYEREPSQRARFHYVRMKMLFDPVTRLLADVAGTEPGVLGHVFDVGTGRGQVLALLVTLGRAKSGHGVDWDEAKVAEGKRALGASSEGEALPIELDAMDARLARPELSDTVLLVDLLHYFRHDEQDELLGRAARAVRPGGRLVLREADAERGWRSFVTLLEERFFTFIRFNRGERVAFRAVRELVALLEREGLSVRVEPAWGKTPFSNVLVVAERPTS
jgi:SAM-dependent methyltransferase